MLHLVITTKFKKDLKRVKKRGAKIEKLNTVIESLLKGQTLAPSLKDHALIGQYLGFRECHIEPDWLLIYAINEDKLILTASRTGTHTDLF